MIKKYQYGTSVWRKTNEVRRMHLRVETQKDYEKSNETLTASFFGDNPFPCFTMVTTYYVLEAWLGQNGWEQYGKTVIRQITDTIDPDTGEVTCHWEKVTINK